MGISKVKALLELHEYLKNAGAVRLPGKLRTTDVALIQAIHDIMDSGAPVERLQLKVQRGFDPAVLYPQLLTAVELQIENKRSTRKLRTPEQFIEKLKPAAMTDDESILSVAFMPHYLTPDVKDLLRQMYPKTELIVIRWDNRRPEDVPSLTPVEYEAALEETSDGKRLPADNVPVDWQTLVYDL